jgi:hypothetical protein
MRRAVKGWLGATVVVLALAGCGHTGSGASAGGTGSPAPGVAGLSTIGSTPSAAPPSTPGPVATTSKPPAVPALTCAQLRNAQVGSTTISYNGYHDSIPLGDGRWAGEDGATVLLQSPCGIGDLNGDGAKDAVGVVALSTGGTGNFYTLVVWRNAGGQPVCAAVADLGDRNPVVSISIAGQKATVVYLTRTDGTPMAAVNLKRTAIYTLSNGRFAEVSHADVAYSG